MTRILRTLLVAVTLATAAFCLPTNSHAQNVYWRNHWGWYDNTYRPYYNNYYTPYYGPAYGGYYSTPYYGGGYYAPPYYGPGVGVRVGRMNFGYW